MEAALPSRHLPVRGCSNFRDLGGYTTADGKLKTRWNRLYRTDCLGKAEQTVDNLHLILDTLRVRHGVDFRGEDEKAQLRCEIPALSVTELGIEPGNVMRALATLDAITEEAAVQVMVDLNELLVTTYKEQYSKFLRLVLERGMASKDDALAFFCTAGKDRTGFAGALILLILGIPKETVFEDYLLTNKYFQPPSYERLRERVGAGRSISDGALDAFMYVRKEYLEQALNVIDARFGGIEKFVEHDLGFSQAEIQQLKDAYLEPV